jgi:DNA (cytosine-5)-methyltransferase 1
MKTLRVTGMSLMSCQNRAVESAEPSVLSCFSGVGGLDLGLESSGFHSFGCIELDPTARRSLKANRGDAWPLLEPNDIEQIAETLSPGHLGLGVGELTLLAGGPPCQPFSSAAMWSPGSWNGLSDSRARPLFGLLNLVDRFLPQCVMLENVSGFVRGRHAATGVINEALRAINARHGTSYGLEWRVLDAANYGVPQRRRRAILISLRDNHAPFAWPPATHADAPVRAWDALKDLVDTSPSPVPQGRWGPLLPSIPEGHNYLWHTDRGGGRPLFGYRTRYWSFLLKNAKALPSWTLPAQPGPSVGPFHWGSRPFKVTELLRLQSFPASWVVEGGRREQVRQVGNATPPLLGELLGRAALRTLGAPVADSPRLAIGSARTVPPPEAVCPVPAEFLELEGSHSAHPGEGLGPRPRHRAPD